MGFQIESGEGNSDSAGVTTDFRLKTSAVTFTTEQEINHDNGQAYSYGVSVTPSGASQCFLYIKNNSDDDMMVSEFMLSAASDETIIFKLADEGTPLSGTTGTPVNRNAGSGNSAGVTALYGVNITGLSGGGSVMSVFIQGGESGLRIVPLSTFIVPKNKTITGYASSGSIAITVGMGISFHSIRH